jgi:hypothetical protein
MGISETHGDTQTPLGMGLSIYIPVENWDRFEETQTLRIKFWKYKIHPQSTPLPCLL